MAQHKHTPDSLLANGSNKGESVDAFSPMSEPLITERYEYESSPEFPLSLMPEKIRQIVQDLHETAGYNIDYTISSMLYAAAIAMGNTYNIKMSDHWYVAPIIYLALVGGPGVGKTHPLSFAVGPLRNSDESSYATYLREKAAYDANAKLLKKDPDKKDLPKPIYRTYLLGDYTPEAMACIHNDNPRGIGVKVDELAGWLGDFNRYNKGSEQEKWLSIWSGEAVKVDRKGSEPIYIPHPFICVGGTIQPGVLHKMAAENRTENGFMDRILFVVPEVKKEPWPDCETSTPAINEWANILFELMLLDYVRDVEGKARPNIALFTPDARTLLFQWQERNTVKCNEDADFAYVGAKMDVYAIRLALIVHALRYASDGAEIGVVGIDDVKASLALVTYFTASALRVKRAAKGDPLAMESSGKKELYNLLPDQFSTAQGLEIAVRNGYPERTAKRFFSESGAFRRVKHGQYSKVIK